MVRYLSFIRWDPVAGSRTTEFEKENPGIRENRGGGTLHRSLEKVRIVSVSHIDLTQEVGAGFVGRAPGPAKRLNWVREKAAEIYDHSKSETL